jgi:hypothetical protein
MVKGIPANGKALPYPEDGINLSRNIDQDLTFTLLQPPTTNGEYLCSYLLRVL